MLRDPALVPLSRQHQHALALCVRIERSPRSSAAEIRGWEREIVDLFEQEIRFHFDAEERVLFPAAERHPELRPLIEILRREHTDLRAEVSAAAAGAMTSDRLTSFGSLLSSHIRREERELFEGMQKLFSSDELFHLGTEIDEDFRSSGLPGQSCKIPPTY